MRRPHILSLPILAASLVADLGAQEYRSALSLLPERPLLVMQVDGPARLAEAFKATNLAKMLGGEELGGLIRDSLKKGHPQLTGVLALLGYRYSKLRDAVLGFRGRLTIAFGMNDARLSEIADPAELLKAQEPCQRSAGSHVRS